MQDRPDARDEEIASMTARDDSRSAHATLLPVGRGPKRAGHALAANVFSFWD